MSPLLDARLEQRQEIRLEQELQLTLKLSLQDPFEYARELHERSQKVKVPITIGKYTMVVDAAIVDGKELETLFEDERFAGIISRCGERYLFFNKNLQVPESLRQSVPKLMAFHCLAAIKMPDFGDETGTLRQFQAIALEMAYARTFLMSRRLADYETWRPTIERSGFFERPDWREIVDATHARFRELVEPLHRNAHRACFPVLMHGERFVLTPEGKAMGKGGEMEIYRKTRPPRKLPL
ncbi:MAG: hypothetical protein AB1324_05995 [Candidatus Micrarchaeota archaeon]